LLLSDSEEEGDEKKASNNSINGDPPESEPVLRCNKLIYASRTHSQVCNLFFSFLKINLIII